MSISGRILKNTVILSVTHFLTKIASFFFIIYIARYLGTNDFGKFSFAFSYVHIFSQIADFGITIFTISEVAKNKNETEKYLIGSIILKTILFIFTLLILSSILEKVLNKTSEVKIAIYILSISIILNSLIQSFVSIFRAWEKMEYEGITNLLISMVYILSGLVLMNLNTGITGICFANSLGTFCGLIFCLFIYKKYFFKRFIYVNFELLKTIFKNSIPIGAGMIFFMIYTQIDKILLSLFTDDSKTGIYNSASTIVMSLKTLTGFFVASIFPIMSEKYKTDKDTVRRLLKYSLKYIILLSFPVVIFTLKYAEEIVSIFYGYEYKEAGRVLQILILTFIIFSAGDIFGNFIISSGRTIIYTVVSGIALLINFILNIILINNYGIYGAAITSLITDSIVTIMFLYCSTKYVIFLNISYDSLKFLFPSLLMGIFLYLLRIGNIITGFIVGIFIYSIIVYFTKIIDTEDVKIIKSVIKSKIK